MSILSSKERTDFIEAASAFISTKERLELIREQAAEQCGSTPGAAFPVDRGKMEAFMEPGMRLMNLLVQVTQKHPGIPAIRCRGHLFSLNVDSGRVLGMNMMREAEIETIDE